MHGGEAEEPSAEQANNEHEYCGNPVGLPKTCNGSYDCTYASCREREAHQHCDDTYEKSLSADDLDETGQQTKCAKHHPDACDQRSLRPKEQHASGDEQDPKH